MKTKRIAIVITILILLLTFLLFLFRGLALLKLIHIDRWDCCINFGKYKDELQTTVDFISSIHNAENSYYLSINNNGDSLQMYDSSTSDYFSPPPNISAAIRNIYDAFESHSTDTIYIAGSQISFLCCANYALVYSPEHEPVDLPLKDCDHIVIRRLGNGWYHAVTADAMTFQELIALFIT